MMNSKQSRSHALLQSTQPKQEDGFALAEFLISALILLVLCASAFGLIGEIQQSASYQTEVQSVLNNSRIAMQTLQTYIRAAGNNPLGCGLTRITIVGPSEVVVQSDLAGSAAPAYPDKGDPDGDIGDSGEHVTLRYNPKTSTLEVVPFGSSSGLSLRYFDSEGNETAVGSDVRTISITVSSSGTRPDPQTHKIFGIEFSSDMEILS